MSRCWKAWLMLLVVGLVLPIAGSPLRFCMQSRVVVNAEESCAGCADATESECDCHQGGRSPLAPGCVTGQKLLPDATSQGDFTLPAPVVMDLLPCALPALSEVPVAGLPNLRTRERDPPHPLPLYLRQEALLL